MRKVTKKQFLEAIENNEDGLFDYEIAKKLNITAIWFAKLRKRYKEEIGKVATEITKKRAERYVHDLERQSKAGNPTSSRTLLEMAKCYVPFSKSEIEAKINPQINVTIMDSDVPDTHSDSNKS